ncbi:MAG: VWA domain-containing protein [Vicinamibacterales bacterium]
MAEPEDLIIDGALVASRLARTAWRRYVPAPADHVLKLPDVRLRIELFLQALFATPLVVAPADAPAPVSWLGRLAGRTAGAPTGAVAGTDGVRIYLPPALDAPRGREIAFQTYLLIAVHQAVRLVRGSPSLARQLDGDEARDRFAIAEAVSADDWIARETPGLVPALRAARGDALDRRRPWPRTDRERAAEARLRDLLAQDPLERFVAVPGCATASEAFAWASAVPGGNRTPAYRGIPPVGYWGCTLPLSTGLVAGRYDAEDHAVQQITRRRVSEMKRRPRERVAQDDEDDAGTGTWIIRTDEPQESVEDPFGLQRPSDGADEADPDALGDALSDLPEARVVRTPGQAREILRAAGEPPRAPGLSVSLRVLAGVAYPEWDFRSGIYRRPGAIVREAAPTLGGAEWVTTALARHARLVRRVRARFERLRPRRARIGRQPEGAELDVAEYVSAVANARAGVVVEDQLYVDARAGRRAVAIALLVDVSASTDSWVSGQQRIIDVEKDAVLVVCEALQALGDPHAVFTFSGEGPEGVLMVPVKRFTEAPGDVIRRRIAALDADGYTRAGAAIRHTTVALSHQSADRRLLLMLSDGKPNDVDVYEGTYGIEDARQAIVEARGQGVHVFCITVDREAPRYAPRIFGPAGYTLLRRVDQLPEELIQVLRRLVRA